MRSRLPVFVAGSICPEELRSTADRVVHRGGLPAQFPFGFPVVEPWPDVHQAHAAAGELRIAAERDANYVPRVTHRIHGPERHADSRWIDSGVSRRRIELANTHEPLGDDVALAGSALFRGAD